VNYARALPALLLTLNWGYAQEPTIVIDGVPATQHALLVGEELYVPVTALTAAGVVASFDGTTLQLTIDPAAAGGANQRESLEGCIGQDLFNGVWRTRVNSVQPLTGDVPGWSVNVELKNGATVTLTPVFTGISGTGNGIQLVLDDGTILPVDPYTVQELTFESLPQGGGSTHELRFYATLEQVRAHPAKFLFEMRPDGIGHSERQAGVAYSVANPSLRVWLDCQAPGN